ncbi:MAG: prolyl oligopeptidase family serine peptidase, partial [Kangiellaceae bacterium]|nr:prolyl oligopeptidase family serine peptidase [Kangiellaceae bacterium]
KAFAKDVEYRNIKLSPDGKHFAAAMPYNDQTILVILERESMQPVYVYRFDPKQHVDQFYWVNNERIVFTRNIKHGWSEAPYSYKQIYAGNFDGNKRRIVFGYQGGNSQTGTRLNKGSAPERAWGEILHLLPDDPEHIIISAKHWDNSFDAPMRIIKLNVYNSKKKVITRTPFGNMKVVLDDRGIPVMARGRDIHGKERSYLYTDRDWVEVKTGDSLNDYNPISVNKDKTKLYLTSHVNGENEALFEYDLKTKKINRSYQHQFADILSYIREPSNNSIIGLKFMPDDVEYHYLDKSNEFARLHAGLAQAFAGSDIRITSRTKNLSEMIIFVRSDTNPGDFYLFNNESKSAKYLFGRKTWIDPKKMAAQRPIEFKNRDGQTIRGYLTLPKGKNKNIPLVTLVHGGPYGIRDVWWFDTDAQLLANNGYAVLQVNYRGSGGYGLNYERMAYRKRASMIQHDIIDGTRWAMSLPEISEDKACIMGWSFGGYSAVMSPLVEPELFKCSIAAAGVYDAVEQEDDADYSEVDSVAAQAAEVYGSDDKLLKSESPLTYIDKLKIPVFIVHGGEDKRVPPEQAHLLREALEKRNKPFEWMFKDKEGHGFYNQENREEFYKRTLAFLNKYLK